MKTSFLTVLPRDHPLRQAKLLILKDRDLAERVGFGLRPVVGNKGLTGFSLSPDPPQPLESRDGRTYCARGAIYALHTARLLKATTPAPSPWGHTGPILNYDDRSSRCLT